MSNAFGPKLQRAVNALRAVRLTGVDGIGHLHLPGHSEHLLKIPGRIQCLRSRDVDGCHTFAQIVFGNTYRFKVLLPVVISAHTAQDQRGAKIASVHAVNGRFDDLILGQSVLGVQLRRKPDLCIEHPQILQFPLQIVHGGAQCLFGLEQRDRKIEFLQIFIQIPAVLIHLEHGQQLFFLLRDSDPLHLCQFSDGRGGHRAVQMQMQVDHGVIRRLHRIVSLCTPGHDTQPEQNQTAQGQTTKLSFLHDCHSPLEIANTFVMPLSSSRYSSTNLHP